MKRFEVHAHTHYSNIRLLDCINKPKDLIQRAIELGLSGISITDHEILSGHVKANQYAQKIHEEYPDFKVALGNEIYLCPDRASGQKYFHFILIAKNKIGHKALRELSSRAWMNSFMDRGMERTVTTYYDLKEIVEKYPGTLIATTACFRKGTQVLTQKGEKNIEDITDTDFILNEFGEWEKVNFPTQRNYNGKGYKITFLENEEPIICTENHKFLTITNNKIRGYRNTGKDPLTWVEAKNLITETGGTKHVCLFPIVRNNYNGNNYIRREEWEYKLLDKTHKRKIRIKDNIEITPELMRLFGLFLGDGSISINKKENTYCINFTFNINEFNYFWDSFIKKASDDIGIIWSKTERPESHRVDLSSSAIDLVELFFYLFNNVKTDNKYIPERLKNISEELNYELIFGYELADGYFRTKINEKKNIVSGEMVSASISKQLSYDIHNLLFNLGIRNSIYKREGRIDKEGTNHKDSWYITSSNNAWRNIEKCSFFTHEDVVNIFKQAIKHCSSKYIEINGIYYKKVYIKEKEEIDLNETVYCLNVDSHSFVCNNVIVHNCLGGQIPTAVLNLIKCENVGDAESRARYYNEIISFIMFCKELFKDDFYIECAPGQSQDQILVNKRLVSISKAFDVKMVLGCDAHYLKKEDRYVHKAYLTSNNGEREVDSFYEYAYLQSEEEIKENISPSELDYDILVKNSDEIYNKIENYSLFHHSEIPKVEVKEYEKAEVIKNEKYPTLSKLFVSDDKAERYWINECYNKLKELNKVNETYLSRLEEEADIKKTIGKKLETNMFLYPITLQHYIDLIWECGSTVGAGRGSSCAGLNHYLLNITQLDPIEHDLPFYRYLNKERAELGDIDIDVSPSRRSAILNKIKEERGKNFNPDVDDLSKAHLGCTLVATFGTETTKSAILTACRGYRSDEFPDGIDVDTAQYLSSLIPQERGFLWSLEDVVYGNKEKDRKPVTTFINEVNQYPRLLDIMFGIQSLVKQRSSHASGVILFNEDPYDLNCFMRTPKGEIITQFDLHDSEYLGCVKYDYLVTSTQDKIIETIRLLQEAGKIEKDLSLREIYNKYLHPAVLPINDKEIWDAIDDRKVLDLFQFDSDVGTQAIAKIQPRTIQELTDANGLLRLMATEKGVETPLEKYARYKNNVQLWYNEMQREGLTKEEIKALEPYFLPSYGVPPSQEQAMKMLMDENICNFSLGEANTARKIIGKKQMDKIPALKEKVINDAKSRKLGQYVWTYGIGPQVGYSFSVIHATAYSYIGFQTAYLATHWNPIYWNTACLIINSGSVSGKGTDYTKLAKAIGDITSAGAKVSLIDINKSNYNFEPNEADNEILFGFTGVDGIGAEVIEKIMAGRPYEGIKDFMKRCPLNKTVMISLIKAGAFDNLDNSWAKQINPLVRPAIMAYYLSIVSEPKKRLTLQNLNGLIQKDLIPEGEEFKRAKEIYLFNKHLKAHCKFDSCYRLSKEDYDFFIEYFDDNYIYSIEGEYFLIKQKEWDNIYQAEMNVFRDWLKENQSEVLQQFNQILFKEAWDKYAAGVISAWEMDSLCFYYHEHELKGVNTARYGISDFFKLPKTPEVEYTFKRNGRDIPIYKTHKIIGTIIGKNDAKSSITLLTTGGVVNVKFTKEYYAKYNRQISEIQEDGKKKVMEKGWFRRGTKVMCTGIRRDDMFQIKTYKKTPTHGLYKIVNIDVNGDIDLEHERYDGGESDEV